MGRAVVVGFCISALVVNGQPLPTVDDCGVSMPPPKGIELTAAVKVQSPAPSAKPDQLAAPVKVNRTIPKVEPPKTALEFSKSPTAPEIFRARIFEEPLVPVGGEATPAENAALAAALLGYSKRTSPDDFSSLTGFLEKHPKSPWRAALLTNLGLEYYHTAHYSLTMPAWSEAWALAKHTTEPKGKAIADRAVGELAYMFARLGRMTELDALLKSVEARAFTGPATERISGAREGLWTMQNQPGIAFCCGPLALGRIKTFLDPKNAGEDIIRAAASTKNGFSLPQVVDLSQKLGLNYQMAFRDKGAAAVVPSVVHWKVGHYAAIVRQQGTRYLVQDPTFRNDVWITAEALQTEASGYFAIPPGALMSGWRAVETGEGDSIWGKGNVGGPDPGGGGDDDDDDDDECKGMAVSSVDLLFVSLSLRDNPVGYAPPVGPPVRFRVRYNQREASQPANFAYSNFGAKWTFDWLSYITDDPSNPGADVQYYRMGGFMREFTGFTAGTQSYAIQLYDQTQLTRTSPTSYEMVSADGSKVVFSQSDGSSGTSRKIFLTQIIDPAGNAVSLTYDANLRLVAVADAIGQVTTLSYEHPADIYKITKVTDPFGRFATFDYDASDRLIKITDVIGLTSEFTYDPSSDFINSLITAYGTTGFTKAESGTTRSLETLYPDGNKERVEFNQSTNIGIPASDPAASVPTGMTTVNSLLPYRNTYFWSKIACAAGYGDYTKAKIYHWLHKNSFAARVLESEKEPLEGRVWYSYAGQGVLYNVGSSSKPSHIGRVLDDGSTQLYTYEYNGFGNVIKTIDPVGRTFSYLYAANGIDLLEVRQTRDGANELLSQTTYNAQHLPLTVKDAAGQTTTYTYNARGQLLTVTNAKNEITTFAYDANGYRISLDGPLPGSVDQSVWTYDAIGRVRTRTDESGYTLTFDHDALDRLAKITFPDGTYSEVSYTRLDHTLVRDRAGRQTAFEYNSVGQMTKRTDPLNRTTLFQWCKCGDLKSLTDPMGRTTMWGHDIQARRTSKVYADGSKISYAYENTTSRLRQRTDESLQQTQYGYNRDNSLSNIIYVNPAVATPNVFHTYDPDYLRLATMTDGTGIMSYSYISITQTASAGAGRLASVDGPLPNDTITYAYDQLGRRVNRTINAVASSLAYDAGGRLVSSVNALGTFTHAYDNGSSQLVLQSFPNGQTTEFQRASNIQDQHLQRITHKLGATRISEFTYTYNVPTGQIASWSQQADAQTPTTYNLVYDQGDQLTAASTSAGDSGAGNFNYSYDLSSNRLTEQIDGTSRAFSYNTLNELTNNDTDSRPAATYQWDAEQRLVSVNSGNQTTQFAYDGLGRRVSMRQLVNGAEVSRRQFLWCDNEICEERDAAGTVTKQFFTHGVKVTSGLNAGSYYYTRDHLGSVRELTDSAGNIRARYAYDLFGRRTRVSGDMEADFGFSGMYWAPEAGLNLTLTRAYDPEVGRWLSRDILPDAEFSEGINLYAYVRNNPANLTDALGLSTACCDPKKILLEGAEKDLQIRTFYGRLGIAASAAAVAAACLGTAGTACGPALLAAAAAVATILAAIESAENAVNVARRQYEKCLSDGCAPCGQPNS